MLVTGQLQLDLIPSRQLKLALTLVHMLAFISVVFFFDVAIQYVVIALLIISASYLYFFKTIADIRQIFINPGSECLIATVNDRVYEDCLLNRVYSSDWVTILSFNLPGMKKTVYALILVDSVNSVTLKKLKSIIKTSLVSSGDALQTTQSEKPGS